MHNQSPTCRAVKPSRGVVEDDILIRTTAKDTPLTTLLQVMSGNDGEGIFVVGDYATHLLTDVTLTHFQSSLKDAAHIQHRAS